MQQSGTKLVIVIVSMAFLLGVTSWWFRFEAAHRASQFWGPEASRLIAESENLEIIDLGPDLGQGFAAQLTAGVSTDLSRARGQAHLRHALMSDRNYVWDEPLDAAVTEWRWGLRFHEGERETLVLLAKNLKEVGKPVSSSEVIAAFSCEPMTASLEQYFDALGLSAKPPVDAASTASE